MNAADYTDGGGWAKLDQRSADMLADVIAEFGEAKLKERTKMILTLYRHVTSRGTFKVGYDQLAKDAGVTFSKARGFFGYLQKNGVIVWRGKKPNEAAEYSFSWATVKTPGENDTTSVKTPGENDTPGVKTPRENRTHKNSKNSRRGTPYRRSPVLGSASQPTQNVPRPDQTATDPALWTKPSPDRPPDVSGGESDG